MNTRLFGLSMAFAGCENLTDVKLNNGLIEIGSFAFEGCSNLIKVDIPSSVERIGDSAFMECSKLANITITVKLLGRVTLVKLLHWLKTLSSKIIPSGRSTCFRLLQPEKAAPPIEVMYFQVTFSR